MLIFAIGFSIPWVIFTKPESERIDSKFNEDETSPMIDFRGDNAYYHETISIKTELKYFIQDVDIFHIDFADIIFVCVLFLGYAV